jgi:DNA-binding XRE family transcriptional regulator
MLLKTGRQLHAARALAGYDRSELARKAGVSDFTIKRLELQDRISANTRTVEAIERALTDAGIELLNDNAPGARLMPKEAAA